MRGIGETGTDSVLLRSFSALDLSILAALENEAPALDAAGYRRLVDAAFSYLRDERDLRGLEPRVGWIHATAHTADLLKFLARDPRFTPADQQRLLDAVAAKLITPGTPVFTHAEDERLAAAVVSVARRSDFDPVLLDAWLERFVAAEKQVWSRRPPEPSLLDAAQNGRAFLRSLYVLLSLPGAGAAGPAAPQPAPAPSARPREGAGDARRDPALGCILPRVFVSAARGFESDRLEDTAAYLVRNPLYLRSWCRQGVPGRPARLHALREAHERRRVRDRYRGDSVHHRASRAQHS